MRLSVGCAVFPVCMVIPKLLYEKSPGSLLARNHSMCRRSRQRVAFAVPDFGDAPKLFMCIYCGALFAVDPDEAYYTKRDFDTHKQELLCPECNSSLASALPYPDNFRCKATNTLEHYERPTRSIPPYEESFVMEFWNPLS